MNCRSFLFVLLAASIVVWTQVQGQSPLRPGSQTDRKTQENTERSGLKHAIGVIEFENAAGFFPRMDLGTNFGIMLESALQESGRFIVVERANLDAVLLEQDLQSSNRAAGGSRVAQTGRLRSARYLATGAITQVEYNESGTGTGINVRGIRVGGRSSRATVNVIVKIVDTTTGEVVAQERIEGRAGRQSLQLGVARSGVGGSFDTFAQSPLGEAAQDCIFQAVEFIAKRFDDVPFEGAVIRSLPNGQILINRGSNYGVSPGEEFVVITVGEDLYDPETGEFLGRIEGETIARLRVLRADERFSYCELVEGDEPAAGSLVRLGGN